MPDFELRNGTKSQFDICARLGAARMRIKTSGLSVITARAVALYTCGWHLLGYGCQGLKSTNISERAFFAGFEEGGFVGTCVMGRKNSCNSLRHTYIINQAANTADGTKYKNTNVVLMSNCLNREDFAGVTTSGARGLSFSRALLQSYDNINGAQNFSENIYAVIFRAVVASKSVRAKNQTQTRRCRIVGPKGVALLRADDEKQV